jgi:hypothetical protein
MSCCGAQNLLLAVASPNFDRCHSFLLASSATGGARKRPHFDTLPYQLFYHTTFGKNMQGFFDSFIKNKKTGAGVGREVAL